MDEPDKRLVVEGTRPAFLQPVNFYEVLADGYHSPLTKTQIAELFYAGRLRRDHRCKQVAQKEWRTIDELFPLLKYQSAGPSVYYSSEIHASPARGWVLIIAFLAAACAAILLWHYSKYDAVSHITAGEITSRHSPRTISTTPDAASTVPLRKQIANASLGAPVVVYAAPPTDGPRLPIDGRQSPLAEQRRQAEEKQREQAERDRLNTERTRLEQKARGQDVIIPLDQYSVVNVGAVGVSVKIHDNDVTSFDVWINGQWRREVPKKKGITQSRTDETFIYDGGHARLYYVWELSGKLNYCLLRVRED